jgi:hypothetical protein
VVAVAAAFHYQLSIVNYPFLIVPSPFSIILFTLGEGFSIMEAFGTCGAASGKGMRCGAGKPAHAGKQRFEFKQ